MLLATIRFLGRCPCPRCLVPKVKISDLGMTRDSTRRENLRTNDGNQQGYVERARRLIFEKDRSVTSKAINHLLQWYSWVPTSVSILL